MAALGGGLRGGQDRRGQILLVRYAGFAHYHQRLVLANLESSNDEFFVLTPDFDRLLESYARDNADITDAVWAKTGGTKPDSLPQNTRVYRFAAWPNNETLAEYYRAAQERCRETDRRRGVMPAATPGGAVGAAPAPALAPGRLS